ncbi:MAG: PfkB family carbohydrate kinase [Candidatus Poseidonia sp.]|nr:PfkB family carbohydrate kinase [Poseidonia sp.]
MPVLIVGSLAYDSVSSPAGSVEDALGGSATYGGLACQFHLQRFGMPSAGLVGVVGEDFAPEDRAVLEEAGLDLQGLETASGSTFRWGGSYEGSMGEAMTHATHLNVFEHFQPSVPTAWNTPVVTFCANLHPLLQASVMDQCQASRVTMLDSMNLWIDIARPELMIAMKRADLVIINDGEVRMLTDDQNIVRAMHTLAEQTKTETLVVKRGEHGVLALHQGSFVALPAYPIASVVDPTGCGDSFAGTLAAHLASREGPVSLSELKRALAAATVTASFTLMSFGTASLRTLNEAVFNERMSLYRGMIAFED